MNKQQLATKIWESANKMRSKIEANEYKDYILGFIFYKFLSDKNKVELTVFILFFIPGTPKDALTYIAAIAPINPIKYLFIATLARIPSIVTSTLLGDSIAEGDYLLAGIVFAITAIISICGIVFGNKYVKKRAKQRENS